MHPNEIGRSSRFGLRHDGFNEGEELHVRDTDITVGGKLPINTGGWQLSAGQAGAAGGMIGVYEAAAQLLGRTGARQVQCRRGLVSGYGMVA